MGEPQPQLQSNQSASHRPESRVLAAALFLLAGFVTFAAGNTEVAAAGDDSDTNAPAAGAAPEPTFTIKQIRVRGATRLKPDEIEDVIYPFVGPDRTLSDVEAARSALEKAHHEKGFEAVAVEIPEQNGTRGIVFLDVKENPVGRLRVKGAKYFLPEEVKKGAPSLQEGRVVDFNEVKKDIVRLNAWPDRRVTPVLRPGITPGTVDVDLNVEDSLPLHGSIEINNRYSPETTELRLNGSISYNNLWQLGHSAGFSFQIAPQRLEDAEVYSAYYIARFSQWPEFSLMLMGTKQNSDVSTLGGAAVAGRGEILGLRGMFTLPSEGVFSHSLNLGIDYKHFDEDVTLGADSFSTPIDYYPFTFGYGASWTRPKSFTELNGSVNFALRGLGSRPATFDAKRYEADGGYFYVRGDLSHTHDLPGGFQVFGKVQGQASKDPLVNSEQFAGGGLATVRGYLESELLGDSGWFVTTELRSPSFLSPWVKVEEGKDPPTEWRLHAFFDGGRLYLNDPLPEQKDVFDLASVGLGTRLRLFEHLNGSIDVAWPLVDQTTTRSGDPFFSFRFWADF